MNCKKCGYKFQKGDKVCQNCGKKKPIPIVLLILAILFFPISLTYLIVKAKKMRKPLKIVLIAVLWIFVLIVGLSDDDNSTLITDDNGYVNMEQGNTPTPTPRLPLQWPESELAQLIPILDSVYGIVWWDKEEEVCIQLDEFTREQYDSYKVACAEAGFNVVTSEEENKYIAQNANGYRLSMEYQNIHTTIKVKQPVLQVFFEIECEANLIFSTYDLVVLFEDEELGGIEHGKTGTFSTEVDKQGTYTLEIRSEEDKSVKEEIKVKINNSGTYKYTVACKSSTVEVSEINKISAPLVAGEYELLNYKDVAQMFKDAGFVNVKTQEVKALSVAEKDRNNCASTVYINKIKDFTKEDTFFTDVEVIIMYDTVMQIVMPKGSEDYEGMNYLDVKKELEALGFVNIEIKEKQEVTAYHVTGEVSNVNVYSLFKFEKGEAYEYDETITIKYYVVTEPTPDPTSTPTPTPSPTFYSTNTYEIAKEGKSGVFSYKNKGGTYDIYWIIDFDDGYTYWFTEGIGENTCDRLPIISGTLNEFITIRWNYDCEYTDWHLHFKYKNHPETLVVNDHWGVEIEFTTTDLDDALELRQKKNIKTH